MNLKLLFLAFYTLLFFSACSVIAAANGSEDPNMDLIKPGATKDVVEGELGEAVKTKKKPDGESALYTYKVGDEPALGRAFLYLLGDIVTLFYAEYLFTPLEASNSGNAKDLIVEYDSSKRVVSTREAITTYPEDDL